MHKEIPFYEQNESLSYITSKHKAIGIIIRKNLKGKTRPVFLYNILISVNLNAHIKSIFATALHLDDKT